MYMRDWLNNCKLVQLAMFYLRLQASLVTLTKSLGEVAAQAEASLAALQWVGNQAWEEVGEKTNQSASLLDKAAARLRAEIVAMQVVNMVKLVSFCLGFQFNMLLFHITFISWSLHILAIPGIQGIISCSFGRPGGLRNCKILYKFQEQEFCEILSFM